MRYNRELHELVSSKIIFLTNQWTQEIDDVALRECSSALRFLLIDKNLYNVANMFDIKIHVCSPLISKDEKQLLKDHSIVYYQSGGGDYKGNKVAFTTMHNRAMSAIEVKQDYENKRELIGKIYSEKLRIYMKQTSFMIKGMKINREEVIKYVANKIGGIHFDPERNSKKQNKLDIKYALLDEVRKGGFITADKDAIYYELLSIGQQIIGSVDIKNIAEAYSQADPIKFLKEKHTKDITDYCHDITSKVVVDSALDETISKGGGKILDGPLKGHSAINVGKDRTMISKEIKTNNWHQTTKNMIDDTASFAVAGKPQKVEET